MAKTQYLEYTINLTDKADVAELQAAFPGGILLAPNAAAIAYLAPIQLVTDPHVNPGTRSPHFILTNPSNYDRNVQSFNRKSGGWFGISFLFGTTTTFKWIGRFVFAGNSTAEIDGVPTEIVAIAKRKFLIGFESIGLSGANGMELTGIGGGVTKVMREASRHTDGLGWFSSGGTQLTADPLQSGDAASSEAWERFYFRVVTAPDVTTRMHRFLIAGAGVAGCSLNMSVDRRLVVHNINNAGAETALGSTSDQYELGTWYRVDLLLKIQNPGGNVRLYVNRALKITAAAPTGVGISQTSTHATSFLGPGALGTGSNQFQCHYDDWICAAWPIEDSQGRYVGKDWLNGSRVRAIPASGLAGGNNWTGDYRYANQFVAPANVDASAVMTTVVSGDAQRLTVDDSLITALPGSLGVVAFYVAWYGQQTVAGNGTLGWKYDGVIDLASHVEGTSFGWTRRFHRPSGATEPIANLNPFELHKVKAANADIANCRAFVLVAECIGVFGAEDVPADEVDQPNTLAPRRGIHNAPYPSTMWARSLLPTISPVIIHTGQYVGNGTAQELQFRCPVGWLMIKRIPSARTGSFWFSSMFTGHPVGEHTPVAGMPVQAMIDPSFVSGGAEDDQEQRTVIRITGSNPAWNENAIAYQYVAFMDPGSRYHLNGAYQVQTAAFVTKDVTFGHSTFLPEYVFYHPELGTFPAASATYTRAIKGPGHAADAGSVMNIAETATAIRHAAGLLTVLAGFETQQDTSAAFSLWRDDDLSSDPNKHNVVRVGSYVGDGAASRTINFATSGKRPVYVIVSPHDATDSHHRDPSDLTNTSHGMGVGGQITTGITAGGIDSFTVGITLNTNGVGYEYFVLIGSATAGNGGWSIDGEFAVVEPDSPEDGDYDDPLAAEEPDPVVPDDPDPDPGPSDEDDCEAGDVCVAATTREVNRALLEIGNTKFLTNYCTQQTLEARTARLLYESSVRSVLHAFPWPFATKYAALALAATQPTHEDWDFAYRQPVDCVFERRLVVDRGTGVDPKGPGYELSSDASGGLILTNEPNAVLEYTCRPSCVAFTGDALFKEALKWHLAEAFASPLTRMPDKGPYCRLQYEAAIVKANAIIKPGQPGLRDVVDVDGADADAACITANIGVVNVALVRIGANTIANLATEQSREAVAANLIFEHELRATLRDYPWKFAKRYVDGPALVGGTATVPVNVDWQYSYRLPADYVAVRRLATEGTGRSFERYPNTFEIGTDDTGNLLFTGNDDPQLEYTARIECAVARADDLFRDALAWRLAYSLAASLAQVDPEKEEARGRGPAHPPDPSQRISHKPNEAAMRERMQRWAFGQYLRAIEKARVADANESEPEPHGDAEWIEGRN